MLGLTKTVVELREHDEMWVKNAEQTILFLWDKFGKNAVDIQHAGSTAIKNIKAKPIIDISVGVADMKKVTEMIPLLTEVGIIHRPSHDSPEYMMFILGDLSTELRTHHIHINLYGSKGWHDRINFRDFMNAHPDKAKEYEALKVNLMGKYHDNRQMYSDSKIPYFENIFTQANEWRCSIN